MPGALVLIGTPIGNLGDLSPRAVEELARADVVACEDSRRTGRLLQHAGVQRSGAAGGQRPQRSPAGGRGPHSPGSGGAGRGGHRRGHARDQRPRASAWSGLRPGTVTPSRSYPVPSAAIAALVASGLPTARFVFEGFLSRKAGARRQRLAELVDDERTLVFYEAPHRLAATLTDLCAVLGAWRRVAVARELTKLHEEIWRGHLNEAAAWAAETPPRGEIALVVQGALPPARPTRRMSKPPSRPVSTPVTPPGTPPPPSPPISVSRSARPTP